MQWFTRVSLVLCCLVSTSGCALIYGGEESSEPVPCSEGLQDYDGDGTCFATCESSGLMCTCDDSSGVATCITMDMSQDASSPEDMEDMSLDMEDMRTEDMSTKCPSKYQDNDNDGTCLPVCEPLECGALVNTCDDSSGVIECTCAANYMGARCGLCSDGYHRDGAACVPDEEPVCDLSCDANQQCEFDVSGTPLCACIDGHVVEDGECVPGCEPACEDSQKCDIEAVGGPTCVDLTCADITCGEFSACVLGTEGPACECVVGSVDENMNGELEAGESCVVTHPQTCAQAKSVYGSDSDGHYKLYVDNDPGKPWWAWCKDMFAVAPLEYLPLAMTHDEHNVFERFGMPHAPNTTSGAAGAPYDRRLTRTYYEKVRIDPVTLRINIFDAQFAQTEVYQDTDTDLNSFHEAVPFGVAQGCSLNSGEEAHGEVNLEQTPFAVLDSFSQVGVCPANTMSTGTGQKIALQAAGGSVSGGCGAIVPDSYSPYFKMGCSNVSGPAMTGQPADPFVLQLAYSNAAKGVNLLPKTCKEAYALGHCVAQQIDSESCSLYVGRDPDKEWTATCADPMSDDPTTYVAADVDGGIGLTDTATIDANGNRTNCSRYEYFRLEPHTMRVDIKDHRFSSIVCTAGDHNDVGIALSCNNTEHGSTVVSQVFLESWTHLVLQSSFQTFGQCNSRAPSGGYTTLGEAYFTQGGSHIDENGMMMVGCGGVAPAEYAAQFGYQSCNAQDDTQITDRPARPSTQQNYLLHLQHTDGNP